MYQILMQSEITDYNVQECREKFITNLSELLSESINYFRRESDSLNINIDSIKRSKGQPKRKLIKHTLSDVHDRGLSNFISSKKSNGGIEWNFDDFK